MIYGTGVDPGIFQRGRSTIKFGFQRGVPHLFLVFIGWGSTLKKHYFYPILANVLTKEGFLTLDPPHPTPTPDPPM
jgi:hypothetical protein